MEPPKTGGGGVNGAPQNWGGGGQWSPPKLGGGGGWEKGSIDRHHQSVIMNSGAEKFFEHSNWSIFFSSNTRQMMTVLNPLDALIPKIPFSFFFFADFWVWVTSEAWGSVSVGFWGSCQLSPSWGRGGSSQGALSTPSPLNCKPGCPFGGGDRGYLLMTGTLMTQWSPLVLSHGARTQRVSRSSRRCSRQVLGLSCCSRKREGAGGGYACGWIVREKRKRRDEHHHRG